MQSGVQATQQSLMAKYIMQLKRKLHSECCSMGYYSQLRAEVSFSLYICMSMVAQVAEVGCRFESLSA